MGNILHGNAKTTPRVREEIQNSKESIAKLAKKYNLNPKTVQKWKNADGTHDGKCGSKVARSVLSVMEQQVICEFRRVTKLSLDDVFVALKDNIPALTRSNLYRTLKRFGLNALPKDENPPREKQKFKDYPPGFVHVDISEIRIEGGKKLYLFVGIDRCSKYVYVELHRKMTMENACKFLKNMINDFPFKITKLLTDNGAQFTYALLAEHLRPKKTHPFDEICLQNGIEHRLTKFRHPWTNGQVEVTNRIIKHYTTKTYHYETADELRKHLMAFLLFYNFKRPLKALNFKTPFDKIIQFFDTNPQDFIQNPHHMLVGLNT
jgi:transposase InsO family protein